MALIHLVYASKPFGFDAATLNGILIQARAHNVRDNISGTLICRADIYIQMLEGPEEAVDAAFARIVEDDRHVEPKLLLREPTDDRLFGGWAMRDDPARSWMWTREELAGGALDRATRDEILAIFERLSEEVRGGGAD
ncbi:BLUF domain-containing protein [Parasphingopyxis algicola]|uniref:BLUF domain-containing protein n=1 Tax=Parasphingopyxis algicola TaxID=2026624 RepID=UPI0015A0C70D|nr:BLUF domain-containing protein [Parasphingopyxis algicola]QLC23961.1 BLUF domain-containing protein [Parasphingopyxis algicola]